MKISQTSVSLLIVAWLFAVLTFYFFQTAGQIRFDEEIIQEIQRKEEASYILKKPVKEFLLLAPTINQLNTIMQII